MFRFALAVLAVAGLGIIAHGAEPPMHPAERAYAAKIAKAKVEYEAVTASARMELKATLEKAVVETTKAGDLDGAIALRKRVEDLDAEIAVPPGIDSPVLGRHVFTYSNGVVRDYIFAKDGLVTHVAEGGVPFVEPRTAKIAWQRHEGGAIGALYWGTGKEVEILISTKDGLGMVHFPVTTAVRARGEKVK